MGLRSPFIQRIQDARDTPYDDSVTILGASDVNTAIELLNATGGISASPGFTWGKSGNVSNGAYLDNDTVPSNITGRMVPLNSGTIKEVFIANENSNTFDIKIQKRSGVSFVDLVTVSVVAARTKIQAASVSVSYGDEIAVMVSSGSCKNPVVGIVIKGTV